MQDWMAYIHQQQPKPDNFTGVNVDILLIDSNGNYRPLGTATTDNKGQYSLTWTPDIPGDYKVYATFSGTKGYWPSNAETTFNMVAAAPTASPAPIIAQSIADQYFLPMSAAIIVAIIVIGALLALLILRKRP